MALKLKVTLVRSGINRPQDQKDTIVGLGLTLLTSVGRVYVTHTAHNPAYRVVGAAAGLLVFLYLFSQLLLFGAALGATGRGPVRDAATGDR